ncbi:MAG: hypothetical protein GY856_02880 [bacterium]|nr:hypothetical protein [bacterium]
MRIVELQRFKVDEAPTGVFVDGKRVYLSATESSQLYSVDQETLDKVGVFDTETVRPVGVSLYDSEVYYLDPATKTVFKSAAGAYAPEKVIDLNALDLGKSHPVLQTKGAEVTDVFVRGKALYCTVQASYSSGVYEISLEKGRVRRFFFSNGPEPKGIVQHSKSKLIYVADAGLGYLTEFSTTGKHTGNAAKLPTNQPHGLDIDQEDNFYVGARDTSEVIRFTVEEN